MSFSTATQTRLAPPGGTAFPEINPWLIAFTVMLATFMEVLDTSVANVALPHIAGSLAATVDETTWVLTSYLVSNAIVLPMSGWLSRLFGRKRFYMTCVLLFTVSSALCGLAPSLTMLIIFRILQGVGGGALQPLAQAILVESFPRHKQGMAMAVYGMGVVFAPIIGPTLGGWITDNYSWRWIFYINIPVGALSLLMTSAIVHDPPYLKKLRAAGVKIDYIGIALITIGLGFLEIVLDEGQRQDWLASNLIVLSAIIALFALVGVVIWELLQHDPIVDLHLLKDRNFAISTIAMFGLGFVLYSSTMLLPLFLQTLMGYTATLSGEVLSPGGFVVLLMLPIVGKLLQRFEARWLVMFGLVVTAIGLLHMSQFNLEIDFGTAVWARIVQSIGLAFLFVPMNTMAFASVAKERANYATGLINLARNVGGSAGIAFVTTLLARRQQFHQGVLVSHLTQTNGDYLARLGNAAQMLTQRGSDPVQAARQAHGLVYGMVGRQAAALSFLDAFWLLGMLFLALAPLMFLVRKTEPHRAPLVME